MSNTIPENKIDVIMLVSDSLSKVNFLLASTLPNEEGYNHLEQKRDELVVKLNRLVKEFISDSTKRYIDAGGKLDKINKKLKKAIQDLQNLKDTIDAITNLVKALDEFIVNVFPLPI